MTEEQELAEFEKLGEKIGALVRAKIIEECALIADNLTLGMSPGPLYSAGFTEACKSIAARIRGSL